MKTVLFSFAAIFILLSSCKKQEFRKCYTCVTRQFSGPDTYVGSIRPGVTKYDTSTVCKSETDIAEYEQSQFGIIVRNDSTLTKEVTCK